MSSLPFVTQSLNDIVANAGRNKQLAELAQKALDAIKNKTTDVPDPEVIFAPLQLATKSTTVSLVTSALDCIGKLISYSYFSVPSTSPPTTEEGAQERPPLIDRAIDTICDCFHGETTAPEVQLQIVQSLLAAVLNDTILVHGAGLLKAVRQVYNIFLLSRNPIYQHTAQTVLVQMVGNVFDRVKQRLHDKEKRHNFSKLKSKSNLSVYRPDEEASQAGNGDSEDGNEGHDGGPETPLGPPSGGGKLTLKDLEKRKSFDDSNMGDGVTMVTLKPDKKAPRSVSGQSIPESSQEETSESLDAEDEIYIRDAYLVFRSFCNLSTKVLPPNQLYDTRGQPMRSKLISLHIIYTLLNNNLSVFTSPLCTITNTKNNEPTSFLQAIKYYLCLSITRNGASSVDSVFDVCCEIFWLMLKYMRASFKVRSIGCSPKRKNSTNA